MIPVYGQYSGEQVHFEREERVLEEGFRYQVFLGETEENIY